MTRHCWQRRTVGATGLVLAFLFSHTQANINLQFTPPQQTSGLGYVFAIDLMALPDDTSTQYFATLDAILSWDPAVLDLIEADDSGAGFQFLSDHFLPDPDGLNLDLHDGDALFFALAPAGQEAPVPADGLVVTTLLFASLDLSAETQVQVLPFLGTYARTQVRRIDLTDVTGNVSASAAVRILPCATGDFDGDSDIDLADFAAFQQCAVVPDEELPPLCSCVFDLEPDNDVDLDDFGGFVAALNGPET